MQEAARREPVAQPPDQPVGKGALGGAHGLGVPFAGSEIVDRDEGGLAPHGKPHVARRQRRIDPVAQRIEPLPALVGKGFRDPRMLGHAGHLHVEGEIHLGIARHAGDGGGVAVMRGRGQRNVALARQKPRGGVEPDPARPRQIDLGPGMQVGEIVIRARRPVQRLEIGLELDQVARDEAGGEAQMAQDLHLKPGAVAAGAAPLGQRLLGAEDARLHADHIGDLAGEARIQPHHHVDGPLPVARDRLKKFPKMRPRRFGAAVDREILDDLLGIVEGPVIGRLLDEEVERIVDRHVGHQIDLDAELGHRLGKDDAQQPVAVGILLVVLEMPARRDLQRMRDHPRARMGRGAQADHLRPERHRTVVAVVGQVVNARLDRHVARSLPGPADGFTHRGRLPMAHRPGAAKKPAARGGAPKSCASAPERPGPHPHMAATALRPAEDEPHPHGGCGPGRPPYLRVMRPSITGV